jgi:hypothetical protein
MRTIRLLLPLCALVLAAWPLRAQQTERVPRPPKSSSTLITEAEIDRARPNVGSAYDVVQSLRPRWLRSRDILNLPSSGGRDMQMTQVHVYMNDRDMGDLEFLKSIPAEQIYTLQYVSTTEAGVRFGPSSGPGIVVTLKR